MTTWPRRPAPPASGHQATAAAGAGGDLLLGRQRIAEAINRSPRTVTRWYRDGRLPAAKIGESPNNLMIARRSDIVKAR
jgi:hypothetical protein